MSGHHPWKNIPRKSAGSPGGAPDEPTTDGGKMQTGEHHWRHGITFRRLADGDVQLSVGGLDFVIPAGEWASIVAAVTVTGDTADSYQRARGLHGIA